MGEGAMELSGYGYVSGYGFGSGSGSGYSSGYGFGDVNGDVNGAGSGYGYGFGSESFYKDFFSLVSLNAKRVLQEPNLELKRIMIEAIGPDSFFSQLECQVVHTDKDGCGNSRSLVKFPMPDTEAGFLQAVRVVCPTTGRQYFLGVPPTVRTCQEAVASTFGLKPDEYNPDRES